MPFLNFQLTHKSEMKVLKRWSKSEISLINRGHENFQFLTKFWLDLKLSEILQINIKKTLESNFETYNWLTSQKWEWWKIGQNLKFR